MAGSNNVSVRVLLVSYPAQGHINPLFQLGKRLAIHHGVRCTLAVARSALGSSVPPGPGAVPVVAISDGCDLGGYDEVGDVHEYLARLQSAGSRTLDELLGSESSHGRPVRVVVYDAFLLWVPRVARQHGASCAAFFTQACSVNVVYDHAWRGDVKLPVDKVLAELPGLPKGLQLEPRDCSSFLTQQDDSSSTSTYLDLLLQQCQGLEVADHVLINSFYELQTEEAEYMASRWAAKTIGPTLPSAYLDNRMPDDSSYSFSLHAPMATECKAWLAKRPARSVVYVSFGSIAAPGPDQLAEMAQGLYNSGKAFLWVVRGPETSKLPKSFVSKVKENEERGLIVAWCPQLEVLAHPAVGCFVTHCGWNSTMEGLGIGVPMVAMPQWSDQPMNAKYIEDVWRVGVRARPDMEGVIRKDEVERCVRQVMDGEKSKEYMENAMNWREKAKRAMSEGGSSDRNIIEFLGKFGWN
ncbi:hypothetical protein BDA96_01G252900 [Sorghum bicolor]|uniref:Glycosyltransferase n=2 Tax=Sorghum bicolor TaxID=4558 RepID=A0A921RZ89_SORBI|nr:crocetin glucosyltransferase 2 [Sorghum bicolor]EER94182.1 hypothetical protein SORBI_3001G238500 [Sorghum bicolor]KAG0549404.1 hypothetical protein BDA96_01G252900 [Sorghum bicolor]|eukprot:XP_002467184.1 crocetin glucosyltransferase 2 [Sorghum bicolor]